MSTTLSRKDRLRTWILEHGRRIEAAELRDDTPLLERRILTSLQLAEMPSTPAAPGASMT